LKLFHFFKKEFFETDREEEEEEDTKLFWESFGSWEDSRSSEEIISDIYSSRKSENRVISIS
jgi:hypothetical protein